MTSQRMLRAGPASEVVQGAYSQPPDPRQRSLDLAPPSAPSAPMPSDPVGSEANAFAKDLAGVAGVSGEPDNSDAAKVNADIAMVAEHADALITALIENAEDHGLEATGDWIGNPLIEARAFEVPRGDRALDKADDDRDQKLNS